MASADLVKIYSELTDEELLEAQQNPKDYTAEGIAALSEVIMARGGLDSLKNAVDQRALLADEEIRIDEEVRNIHTEGVGEDFYYKMIKSDILSPEQVNAIILSTLVKIEEEKEDRKLKPRTVLGGAVAMLIAALVGGILWGLQMIWSGHIFYIFIIGLVLLCYGIIKLATGQTHRNSMVAGFTLIATIAALAIGQILLEIFGVQKSM